ncbi:MAG: histidine kinase [Rubrivivax sp. SCN 71-131]|mgnify:CR=1 FL=1|nr:MAG: histidine kinase [Rubrivivax sp. SCN 71-131]
MRWSLGAKLAIVGLPFLLLGLVLTALTLWVSWQLDGGAASVNEAGRMRMQAYRLAWTSTLSQTQDAEAERVQAFERSLVLLEHGDPERPLVTPFDDRVRARFAAVQAAWAVLRALHLQAAPAESGRLDAATVELVGAIDALVSAIEHHLSRYTTILHLLQVALLVAGTLAAALVVVVGYHVVLEPVVGLRHAVSQLRGGDLATRVEPLSGDELGELAIGFNEMAQQLQASYANLEQRVREKTAELQGQSRRLKALYDASVLVARSGQLQSLAEDFTRLVRAAAGADAAALRYADPGRNQFVLLATDGVPPGLVGAEHCIQAGDCHCGQLRSGEGTRVIPIRPGGVARSRHCESAGWASVVALPIQVQEQLIGELDLFFHAQATLPEAERTHLETLASHLASGMDNLRLHALEREAAVAQERTLLARELHDSIAQSLAFLAIQAQLMRRAMAAGDQARMQQAMREIEAGLRESHGDVRELLVHFRTRTNEADMAHALQATLRKFEHQTGMLPLLSMHDEGLPLPPDMQVQALHIVQEALSNVRKHARASRVWVDVWKHPAWRVVVRDDGRGFDTAALAPDAEAHVGLRIMAERAARLGATLQVESTPGEGTTVTLQLPAAGGGEEEAAAAAPEAARTAPPAAPRRVA